MAMIRMSSFRISMTVFILFALMMRRTCLCFTPAAFASSTSRLFPQRQHQRQHVHYSGGSINNYGRKLNGSEHNSRQRRKMTIFSSAPTDAGADSVDEEDIFGSEFRNMPPPSTTDDSSISTIPSSLASVVDDPEDISFYLRKSKDGVGYKQEVNRILKPEGRAQVMKGYDQMRASFIEDSIFVSVMGLSLVLWFGTFKDAVSFGIGAVLGGFYAVLLSSYVEKLGNNERNTTGNLRFAPVILLIAIYSKNKEYVNFIPELLGFSCYQIGSLLQAFNEDAYEN